MGEVHDLHCSKCGYGIKATLGIGMMYSEQVIFHDSEPLLGDLVNEKDIVENALQLVKTEKVAENYGHRLYACPNDFYLFNRFFFKVGSYEPEYPCPYCQNTLQQVTFAKGDLGTTKLRFVITDKFWQCPKCGNDALTEFAVSNWD